MKRPIRDVVYDIIETLKQTFDDRDINPIQVTYWVLLVGNQLKSKHISNRSSGAHLAIFAGVPVGAFTSTTNPNQIAGRKYVYLPQNIYDYDLDAGIHYISYFSPGEKNCPPRFTKVKFDRTTPAECEWLYMHPQTTPSPKNPFYYRAGDYVYLLGLECVNVKELEMGLFTTLPSITEVNIDAEFDFPVELDHVLTRQVLDLARFSLMVPGERINDGNDSLQNESVPTNKIASVNPQEMNNQ